MFTFCEDKSLLKMAIVINFCEFLKTCSLWSNSVTRQVNFNWSKIGGKCQNWRSNMRHFRWFSNTMSDKIYFKTSYHNNFHFQSSRLATSCWAIYPGRGCLNPGVLRPQQHPLDVPCSFGQVTKVVNVTQLLT